MKGHPQSTISMQKPGKGPSTKTTSRSTNMQQQGSRRPTKTHNTTSSTSASSGKPEKHQWEPRRSGFQCHTCHTRVHQALTVQIIEQRLQQDCELLAHEAPEPDLRRNKPVGQKTTRASTIKQLLDLQQQQPRVADEHNLQETTGYLRCTKCSLSIHKRTNEESFQAFIRSRCVDESYTKPHAGHTTHSLWQKGKGIKCLNCGTQSHLDAEERLVMTKTLTKACQSN